MRTEGENESLGWGRLRLRDALVWSTPLAILFVISIWMAFSSGGYVPSSWLPGGIAIAFIGLVISSFVTYLRRPRRLSSGVVALFAGYAIWTALSVIWAASSSRAWLEAGRTFAFVILFALALLFLTHPMARKAFRYLLIAWALVITAAVVWRLWTTVDLNSMFLEGRLTYPMSYPNNAAALFLVAFWPLIWLASGSKERAPVRGVALGLATGLLGLAMLTQSRGGIWSLAISAVVMFVVSPARMRMLLYLVVPGLLTVYEFPSINSFWLHGVASTSGGVAARSIVIAIVVAALIGTMLALLERWIRVSLRMKVVFAAVILLGVLAAAVYGTQSWASQQGGLAAGINNIYQQFVSPTSGEGQSGVTRFSMMDSSGRVGIWKVAWQEFERNKVVGVGADNFVFEFNRLGQVQNYWPQQAHSIELQVLGETGIVGGVFAFGAILMALIGMLWPRFASGWAFVRYTLMPGIRRKPSSEHVNAEPVSRWGDKPAVYGWEMSIVGACCYWFVHASVDWLWQAAGVAIPALLLLAAGLSSLDARSGAMRPWFGRLFHHSRSSVAEADPEVAPNDLEDEEQNGSKSNAAAAEVQRPVFFGSRRSDRYEGRRARRVKRYWKPNDDLVPKTRRSSQVYRGLLILVSAATLLALGLPYLSLQMQDSALAVAKTDPAKAISIVGISGWLFPGSPDALASKAIIYASAAVDAVDSSVVNVHTVVPEDLALAADSYDKATAIEPADWSLHYHTGVALLNLLLARDYLDGVSLTPNYAELLGAVPGLQNWSALSDRERFAKANTNGVSLVTDADTSRITVKYLSMSRQALCDLALRYLYAAKERNPQTTEIGEAIKFAVRLRQSGA